MGGEETIKVLQQIDPEVKAIFQVSLLKTRSFPKKKQII